MVPRVAPVESGGVDGTRVPFHVLAKGKIEVCMERCFETGRAFGRLALLCSRMSGCDFDSGLGWNEFIVGDLGLTFSCIETWIYEHLQPSNVHHLDGTKTISSYT